jgi:hypothetical protein
MAQDLCMANRQTNLFALTLDDLHGKTSAGPSTSRIRRLATVAYPMDPLHIEIQPHPRPPL